MPRPDRPLKGGRIAIYRHPAAVRLAHWLNALAVLVLLTSGLGVFNAHPALYLGDHSQFDRPLLAMESRLTADNRLVGVTRVGGREVVTTGLFGVSGRGDALAERGFPAWATWPSGQDLATSRRWHFFFAWVFALNGAAYVGYGLASGRIRRELLPSRAELASIGASVRAHLALRFPRGEAARRYNVLQKLSYLVVLFGLLPLMVVTGMSMSPGIDAAFPWLPAVFGGRQSARTVHFAAAALIVLFVLVHLVMLVAAGAWNGLRSMLTGRYVIDPAQAPAPENQARTP
jgi:thiosulfate reductase cytochrome b subunit